MAHGVIAFAIASVGAIAATVLAAYVKDLIFGFPPRHLHGHPDPGLLLAALLTFSIAWGFLFKKRCVGSMCGRGSSMRLNWLRT